MADPTPVVRTAQASERPCELHRYHSPVVVRTQGHHHRCVYLQNRVYGSIQDPELMWACGTCHDSIHAWIDWLLREARRPTPAPGPKVRAEAQRTVDWYLTAKAERASS